MGAATSLPNQIGGGELHTLRRRWHLRLSDVTAAAVLPAGRLAAFEYQAIQLSQGEHAQLLHALRTLVPELPSDLVPDTAVPPPRMDHAPWRRVRGIILVMLAASLWGTLGIFYRRLVGAAQLDETVVISWSSGIAGLVVLSGILLVRPTLLRVKLTDWPLLLVVGTLGEAGYYLTYAQTAVHGTLAVAAMLPYTATVWLTLWAAIRHRRYPDRRKLVSLGIALLGTGFVTGFVTDSVQPINGTTLHYGLASGICYAIYSLGSAEAVRRGYHPWCTVVYTLLVGAIVLGLAQPVSRLATPFHHPAVWGDLLVVALIPTLIAPLCFTVGLRTMTAADAALVSMIEPVVATMLGWVVVVPRETLSSTQAVGAGMVLGAVTMLASDQQPDHSDAGTPRDLMAAPAA